jgi:Sodium/hydrogen exchanger family
VLGEIDLESSSGTVRALAEATLGLVLFCDASRIDLGQLRREVGVPVRLLGIGLPLTIALGAVAAAVIFDQLSIEEAVILAIVLAPTDPALGQAVVTEPRVPGRIRQGLNVESGLNDGICVPGGRSSPLPARRLHTGSLSRCTGRASSRRSLGMVFRLALKRDPEELNELSEESGTCSTASPSCFSGRFCSGPPSAS